MCCRVAFYALIHFGTCTHVSVSHRLSDSALAKEILQFTDESEIESQAASNRGKYCGVEFSDAYVEKLKQGTAPQRPFYPYSEHCAASYGGGTSSEMCTTPVKVWFSCNGTNTDVSDDSILAPGWQSSYVKKGVICTTCEKDCSPWALCPPNSQRYLYYERIVIQNCQKRCNGMAKRLYNAPQARADASLKALDAGNHTSGAMCQCGCGEQGGECGTGQCKHPAAGLCRSTCRPCCVGSEIGDKCAAGSHLFDQRAAKQRAILQKRDTQKRALDNSGGYAKLLGDCTETCSNDQINEALRTQTEQASLSYKIQQSLDKLQDSANSWGKRWSDSFDYQMAHVSGQLQRLDIALLERAARQQCIQSPEVAQCVNLFSRERCIDALC